MTRYEKFKFDANKLGIDDYRRKIEGNGGFDYNNQVKELIRLENNINGRLLQYLFGEQLGEHYMREFVKVNKNLLTLFSKMDNEAQFFMLHELKTNENLFANC
jgi:hypothetical protein